MKHILILILTILTIVGSTILSLLVNYASEPMPQIFQQNPSWIWLLGGTIVVILVLSAYGNYFLENWKSRLAPQAMIPKSKGDKMKEHKYDVFISYSHKDSEWVQGVLLPKLEKHSFSVLIDTYFQSGSFGPIQMEDGVKNSKRVIAVFTKNYFESEWATLENVMAQILDPATRKRKLIPVLRENCDIPLRLAGIHYRDLRLNDEHEWQRLIQDLI